MAVERSLVNGYKTRYVRIEGPVGPLKLLVAEPDNAPGPVPGILWIHGGGYMTGMPEMLHISRPVQILQAGLGVVVCPQYRLAWRAPYPAAVEDCYAGLLWMKERADELGINSDQLFVGGESAGGGLTAAVCLMARDRGQVNIAYQMPLYPMLDCFDTESSRDNHGHVWDTARNHWGWRHYLGKLQDSADIPAYASAAREVDYSGLPPTYTFVSTGEPFYAETLEYVENLQGAGIEAHCDVYEGDTHAFDMLMPWQDTSKEAARQFMLHYLDALEKYHAPQV